MQGIFKLCCTVWLAAVLTGCDTPEVTDNGAPTLELTSLPTPAAPASLAPHLARQESGGVVMSWLEPADDQAHALRFSVLDAAGQRWSPAQTIAQDSGWFVNSADVPSVVPITADLWAAHWLDKRPGGTYSYDIQLAVSADGGQSWSTPMTPHNDNTPTEHGFVSIFPWSDGFGAVWLDGRNMRPDTGAAAAPDDSTEFGGMSLRYARFDASGQIREDGEIDDLVCECCMTDVAMSAGGPVVAYRNRTSEEIRDILIRRYENGGWSEPMTVSDDNWQISGCPVNGPAIAADGEQVAVAWYAAPNRKGRVKVAFSTDAGQTFAPPILLDSEGARGRVDITLLKDSSAEVSWVGKAEDGAGEFHRRRVTAAGELDPVHSIRTGEYSRSSFPQMVGTERHLVLAWPVVEAPPRLLTAVVPLQK